MLSITSAAFVASFARKAAARTTPGVAPTVAATVADTRSAATATTTTTYVNGSNAIIKIKNSPNNAKLRCFRQIINSRASARRFQPNTPIPDAIWKDILSLTLVGGVVWFGTHTQLGHVAMMTMIDIVFPSKIIHH